MTEITGATGELVERYEYDVYGEVAIFDGNNNPLATSAIGNPYLFTGRRFDPESGNYYYRARIYSPSLGRFLSMDPLGLAAGDYNLYRYVFNNPVNFVDPTGKLGWVATGLVGGVVNLFADYLITTYIDQVETYPWWSARTAIVFGTGFAAGVVGAGIGHVATNLTKGVVGWGIRVAGNSLSTAGLNSLQRWLKGECTTLQDVQWDLLFGGVGGALDGVFTEIVRGSAPHINRMLKKGHFLTRGASPRWAGGQGNVLYRYGELPLEARIWEPALSGLSLGLSNSSFLNAASQFVDELLNSASNAVESLVDERMIVEVFGNS